MTLITFLVFFERYYVVPTHANIHSYGLTDSGFMKGDWLFNVRKA